MGSEEIELLRKKKKRGRTFKMDPEAHLGTKVPWISYPALLRAQMAPIWHNLEILGKRGDSSGATSIISRYDNAS